MLSERNRLGIALLIMRVVIGAAFVMHGTSKVEQPFTWMNAMPFHPPAVMQALAAVAEFFGGLALIFGIATPLAAAMIGVNMVVAILAVHVAHGAPVVSEHGESLELPGLYLMEMIVILLAGPRHFSIDAFLVRRVRRPRNIIPPSFSDIAANS